MEEIKVTKKEIIRFRVAEMLRKVQERQQAGKSIHNGGFLL